MTIYQRAQSSLRFALKASLIKRSQKISTTAKQALLICILFGTAHAHADIVGTTNISLGYLQSQKLGYQPYSGYSTIDLSYQNSMAVTSRQARQNKAILNQFDADLQALNQSLMATGASMTAYGNISARRAGGLMKMFAADRKIILAHAKIGGKTYSSFTSKASPRAMQLAQMSPETVRVNGEGRTIYRNALGQRTVLTYPGNGWVTFTVYSPAGQIVGGMSTNKFQHYLK